MQTHHLTLAENKLILYPKTSGFILFELTLLELLFKKKLDFISSRANDVEKKMNGFLKVNHEYKKLAKNLVYSPILNALKGMPQLQLSGLVKTCNKLFNKDFECYKNDYILKRLKEKHGLIKTSMFNNIFGKIELTDKGKGYQKELIQNLSSYKGKLQNAAQIPINQAQAIPLSLGANILLLGKNYLQELKKIDLSLINSQLIENNQQLGYLSAQSTHPIEFLDFDLLSNMGDFVESFVHELSFEGFSESIEVGLELSSLLPDFLEGLSSFDF